MRSIDVAKDSTRVDESQHKKREAFFEKSVIFHSLFTKKVNKQLKTATSIL
jgi:hypothetical protein